MLVTNRFLAALMSCCLAGMLYIPDPSSCGEEQLAGASSHPLPERFLHGEPPAALVWREPSPVGEQFARALQLLVTKAGRMEMRGELREDENLVALLKRLQVPRNVRHQIIESFGEALDFRRMRPGGTVSVSLGADGKLIRCSIRTDLFESFTLAETTDGWKVTRDSIPLLCQTVRISGTVKNPASLEEAFSQAGGDAKLARAFADMLFHLIDLDRDLAPDDRFSILAEKYYQDEKFIGYGRILMGRYEQAATGGRLSAVFFEAGEKSGYFNLEGKSLNTSFLPLPVPGARIASRFSSERQHPILNIVRPHFGIDLAAPEGTPVLAAADGQVKYIGYNGGFGRQIVLKHAGGVRTHYGHLSRYEAGLEKGARVKQQDVIGYVGATGLATGPHLDYRVERNGIFIDPLQEEFLDPPLLTEAELLRLQLSSEIYDMFMEGADEQEVLAVKELNLAGPAPSLLPGML